MFRKFSILILLVSSCFYFNFVRAQNTSSETPLNKTTADAKSQKQLDEAEKAIDISSKGLISAKFVCPRYLLLWSVGVYNEGAKEDALKILKVAKDIAQLAKKSLLQYPDSIEQNYYSEKLKDQNFKEKMEGYLDSVIKAAEEQEKYFNSGDDKYINIIDEHLKAASDYDKELEAMLGEPMATGNKAVSDTIWMCPRWFVVFAEKYYASMTKVSQKEKGRKGKIVPCEDCAQIINSAKTINEVSEKAIVTEDATLKEKISSYISALSKMNDAYIEFYKTGDKKLADDPYKYRDQALAIEEDMNNYLTSKQKEQQ